MSHGAFKGLQREAELVKWYDGLVDENKRLRDTIDLVYKTVRYEHLPKDTYTALTAFVQADDAWEGQP